MFQFTSFALTSYCQNSCLRERLNNPVPVNLAPSNGLSRSYLEGDGFV